MQLTFGDAECLGKRKQTRREIFLAEMEQVVPWQQLLGLVAPHYPVSGRPGRQPYALATMLRIHLLQQWYALSDPAMEEALHEIPTLRRFAQLGGLDNVPDETTILNFRRLLETHGLAARMLEAVNAHLARKGQSLRSGTIVDATLIAAPSSTKNADHARDPEMRQTKKGNQWYFGMKAHIGVDEFSGLVHHVHCTAANVADVTVTHAYKWLCAPRGVAFATIAATLAPRLRPLFAGWYAGGDPWSSCYGSEPALAECARRFDVSPAWQAFVGAAPALAGFAAVEASTLYDYTTTLTRDFRAAIGLDEPARPSAIVTWHDPDGTDLMRLQAAGLTIAARTPVEGLTETVELPTAGEHAHPWFLGVQFHPEFTSTPRHGHPLFIAYIKAALAHASEQRAQQSAAGDSQASQEKHS